MEASSLLLHLYKLLIPSFQKQLFQLRPLIVPLSDITYALPTLEDENLTHLHSPPCSTHMYIFPVPHIPNIDILVK